MMFKILTSYQYHQRKAIGLSYDTCSVFVLFKVANECVCCIVEIDEGNLVIAIGHLPLSYHWYAVALRHPIHQQLQHQPLSDKISLSILLTFLCLLCALPSVSLIRYSC
jgi:hypothetical protein